VAEISDVLADFGVHIGFQLQRHQLAMQLASDGFTDADVLLVAQHVEQTVDAAGAGAVLASLLNGSPAALRDRVADVKRFADAKAKRDTPTSKPYPGGIDHRHGGDDFAKQDDARQARMAYCRVIADRVDPEAVAKELGVSRAILDGLVQRGFEMQGGRGEMPKGKPMPRKKRADREEAQP
jgi:hypothetical protein